MAEDKKCACCDTNFDVKFMTFIEAESAWFCSKCLSDIEVLEKAFPGGEKSGIKIHTANHAFAKLTQLQRDYGYKEGDINPVALLGLFGEAAEVLAEVILLTDKNKVNTLQGAAVNIGELVDDMKKQFRKDPAKAPGTFIMAEDGGAKLDTEMADVLYYLNLLALNRGKDLAYYAQLSVDKVTAKSKAQ